MDIEKLNDFIHENLINRRSSTPYRLLQRVSEQMTHGIKIPDRYTSKIEQTIDIDRAIKIAMDFFKSVDPELYVRAEAIFERRSEFEFNIYYKDEVSPNLIDKRRKDGMPIYTRMPCLHSTGDKQGVYVPCDRDMRDTFSLVHEISHSFDYVRFDTPARNLLGEVTSHTFEAMLQQYLLENQLISREDAVAVEKVNLISHYDDGVETYAKLILMQMKESRGPGSRITEEDLEQIKKQYNISDGTFKFILNRMMDEHAYPEVDYRARYMTAQLIYPYVMEQYYRSPMETVARMKQYFDAIKQNDLDRALLTLGIEPREESIPMLIDSNNRRISRLYKTKLFDEESKTQEIKKTGNFLDEPE